MKKQEISVQTKKKLAKIFTTTGEAELQVELLRQNLCKVSSFEPYASFQRIDRLAKGYITARDVLHFMRDNGYDQTEENECKHVCRYFDAQAEDRLHYIDYLQILLPCDQPYLRAQATQRPTYPVEKDSFLPYEVEQALAKLFGRELKLARDVEK